MSSDLPEGPADASRVERVRIEEEMEQSYIDYAMSVIAGRALPDVRDGLKPVHRRILYAMYEMGVTSGAAHRKSSSIVGETMGDYHPHGDVAIYDTLVRMAQDFSMRYPLVDGQGNFGSMDGDPPAAMRYTEARMTPLAEELLADIEKDTVDFSSNYDDRLEEPDVLPAKLPNLLLNGASGIAVGMSTNVPPHNLGEVVDATIHLIEHPDCDVADLMEHVKGPDFPTGANIVGREAIHSAYTTGRGRLRVRAEYEVEEADGGDRIVITEVPFQENKARMVERIADDVNEGTIEGVSDLRDESDRNGVRVVIELSRGANVDVVENQLLEHHLESTFGVINLALVDGEPRVLDLKETLHHYVEHRKDVVTRRSEHDLAEAEERAHILEGRLKALDRIEAVVDLIRNCEDRDAAKAGLQGELDLETHAAGEEDREFAYQEVQEAFDFTQAQAEHIVRMQLGSLTSMEAAEIEAEYEDVQDTIEYLESILASEEKLLGVITAELREIRDEYDDERRTDIVEDHGQVTHEDLIPEEDVVVVVTEDDYIKRMAVADFEPQGRGGKGIIGADPKEGDRVSKVFRANTHDYLLCFTNRGQVYRLKTYEVPEMGRTARGKSAVNLLELDDGEEITAVVDTDDFGAEECITMVTRQGYVKRTAASDFENILSTGIIAARLGDNDELVDVVVTTGSMDLVIATAKGRVVRIDEDDINMQDRDSKGVRGISLHRGDAVASITVVNDHQPTWLLSITRGGKGKRTPVEEYPKQSRGSRGVSDSKLPQRGEPVHAVEAVKEDDHLILISGGGQIMRTKVDDISIKSRDTIGINVFDIDKDDTLASMDVIRGVEIDEDDKD